MVEARLDIHLLGDTCLLDCQPDSFDAFDTRIVAPLLPVGAATLEFTRLTPRLRVGDGEFVLAPHLPTAVDRRQLGPAIGSLAMNAMRSRLPSTSSPAAADPHAAVPPTVSPSTSSVG